MTTNSYQFLPELLPEEFEALKSSVAERGVDVPIIVDQDGEIIEGFHRQRACDELRIFCPREVRHFENEAEKYELALRMNCRRRQLNRKQKRELIAAYLLRDPQIADNSLSEILGGVSKNTVAEVRHELEATCQIDKFETLRGKDQKQRPRKYKKIIANTSKEADKATEIIGDLPDNCLGKTLDVTSAKRRAKRQTTKRQRQELIERATQSVLPEDVSVQHCSLTELEVPQGEVDLILTDVMWNDEAEPDWRDLGRMAMKWLKPNGLLATYIGQQYLVRMANAFTDAGLHYQTCFCGEFATGSNAAEINGVISRWRAVPVFAKKPRHVFRKTMDLFDIGLPEKEWSHLQQTVKGTRWLLEHLSDPGDLVVDPCLGTGTTGVAIVTADGPRRFIGGDRDEERVKIAQHRISVAKGESPGPVAVHTSEYAAELAVILEDSRDLGCVTSKEHVRSFLAMLTDCEASSIPQVVASLPESLITVYERLPDVAA